MAPETVFHYSRKKQVKWLLLLAGLSVLFLYFGTGSTTLSNPVKQSLVKVFMVLMPIGTVVVALKLFDTKPVVAVSSEGVWDRRVTKDIIPWTIIDDVIIVRTQASGNTVDNLYLDVARQNRRTLPLTLWARLNANFAGTVKGKGLHVNTAMLEADATLLKAACSHHLQSAIYGSAQTFAATPHMTAKATKLFG